MTIKKLPDGKALLALREEGLQYRQIAQRYGVSISAVTQALQRARGEKRPYKRHADVLPWKVATEHSASRAAQMLRLYGRKVKGEELPADKASLLDSWLREVNHRVVCYSRDTGFFYVAREDTDRDRMVRA